MQDDVNNLFSIGGSYRLMTTQKPEIYNINTTGLEIAPGLLQVVNDCVQTQPAYFYDNDARLVDARGMRIGLDAPALIGYDSKNLLSDTDDKILFNSNPTYKNFYKNYSEMNNGQIMYYVDEATSQPFYGPVYTLSSNVDKTLFKDPMGSTKPYYYKYPTTSTLKAVSRDQATRDGLSFREGLMADQQNLYNRTSWTNRYTGN